MLHKGHTGAEISQRSEIGSPIARRDRPVPIA